MTILTAGGSFADAYLASNQAEIVSARSLDQVEFKEGVARATTIIHNAATIHCSNAEEAVDANFEYTKKLVKLVKEVNPAAHLVLLSSMSVLASDNENAYADVLSMSPYALSKYMAEVYCLHSELTHLSCVRFSTLFYKNPLKDGLSKLITDAVEAHEVTTLNGGSAKRDFLPLDIAAAYIKKISTSVPKSSKVYNLASGEATSFQEVVEMLKRQLPDLRVKNVDMPQSMQVLAQFSSASIEELGRISFSLEDEVCRYVKELNG